MLSVVSLSVNVSTIRIARGLMSRTIVVTGIAGQDGSYLTELCLNYGFKVHGFVRRTSSLKRERLDSFSQRYISEGNLQLHYVDLCDTFSIHQLLVKIQPSFIFNLAAQSHVGISFDLPRETIQSTGLGILSLLEAVRHLDSEVTIYQAGSSEMFGGMLGRSKLNESSGFFPKSPYGAAKVLAHNLGILYRDGYGMDIRNGILFNHESPRRGENFVSRKITLSAARIHYGIQRKVALGNLEARRDWGHAKDYVEAMLKIVLHKEADDFVIATGQMYTVSDFAEKVFNKLNLNYRDYVEKDERLFRPNEVDDLLGDARKAHEILGWSSQTTFDELIEDMLESDLKLVRDSI